MERSLRPASEHDLAFCESLNRSNTGRYRATLGIEWDRQRFAADWSRFENLVIVQDGAEVGTLRLLPADRFLEIRDLQVTPAHQRQGIGSWALDQAKSMAADRGCPQLRLRVYADNPAQALYTRSGFCVVGNHDGVLTMACQVPKARG